MARPSLPVGTFTTNITARPQVLTSNGKYRLAPAATPKRDIARWRAQGTVRDFTGKSSSKQAFGATKVAAEQNLRAALQERLTEVQGEDLHSTDTVAKAAAAWLADVERKGRHAAGSMRVYRLAVDKHIVGTAAEPGALAALKLREVTAPRVERALQAVADNSGAGMAKTVRTVLRNIFSFAVYQSAMPHNPVTDVRPVHAAESKAAGARITERAFTPDELSALLAAAVTDPKAQGRDIADLLYFLDGTGVRVGEALAVRWDDMELDGDSPIVRVGRTTVVRIKGDGLRISDHGRTKRHDRTLPLTNSLAAVLRARRGRTAILDNPHGVVFVNALGGSLRDPSNTAHHIRDLMDVAGLPWATAHTFRHTVATRLSDDGTSVRKVADWLGHSKVSMTQDVYLSRDNTVDREAAKVLERPRLRVVS